MTPRGRSAVPIDEENVPGDPTPVVGVFRHRPIGDVRLRSWSRRPLGNTPVACLR